jgi:sulfite exporter TauE/SafE
MEPIVLTSSFTILLYGFLIGLKHATDVDHLAAVSTIVAEKKELLASIVIGGLWGLGHTVSLTVAGIFVLFLNFEISENLEKILEFCVGTMLVLLGLNILRKLFKGATVHIHEHSHGNYKHTHFHVHEPQEEGNPKSHHRLKLTPQALIVGMIHGLAGSAGLMLIVIPTIKSKIVGLLYILIFGIGSIGGMILMSLILSLPFALTAKRFAQINRLLQALAAGFSIFLGFYIMHEIGFGSNT